MARTIYRPFNLSQQTTGWRAGAPLAHELLAVTSVHTDHPKRSSSSLIAGRSLTDVSVLILFPAPLRCGNTLEINYSRAFKSAMGGVEGC